jgi:UDP-N-acetylmuramoyl-L-alanyl-D-glutamate--2,6-diaminopimelate ligase
MRLSALLACLSPAPAGSPGGDDPIVRGLCYDSRAVAPGDLFVALRGSAVDGHAYLGQALGLGAVAVVVEEIPAGLDLRGRPAWVVADTRRALAALATRFYGEPSSELALIGVTGTNGKTSTTYLIESILARAGRRVGLIGTVESRFAGRKRRSLNTTPESLDLQTSLRDMLSRGADAVVMEVSSHGLALGRVDGCRFKVGAFTNLTQDHLDFHGSMAAYRDAKALLFTRYLASDGKAVVNVDDPAGPALAREAESAGASVIRVSRGAEAEVRLETADVTMDGTRAGVAIPGARLELAVPLLGDFNLENVLVACGVAFALGVAPEVIEAGVAACPQVPGRVERVAAGEAAQPTVLVDYAHTPDAVDKLLRTLRPLTSGRLVTVFGCGGDRDRAKRSLMAEAVARWSDLAVATSDNPRSEDPRAILTDVERGLEKLKRVEPEALGASDRAYATVVDRRAAIALAIGLARPDDTVVLAGKGHEDYQIVGRERLPFSDRDEARRAFAKRGVR